MSQCRALDMADFMVPVFSLSRFLSDNQAKKMPNPKKKRYWSMVRSRLFMICRYKLKIPAAHSVIIILSISLTPFRNAAISATSFCLPSQIEMDDRVAASAIST